MYIYVYKYIKIIKIKETLQAKLLVLLSYRSMDTLKAFDDFKKKQKSV